MEIAGAKAPSVRLRRVQSFVPALLVLVFGVLFIDAMTAVIVLSHLVRGQVLSDWLSFYTAGQLVRSGHASQLFDASVQAATQRQLFGEGVRVMGYPLPAFAGYFFAPFSKLSFAGSYFAFLAINVLALATLARFMWGWLRPSSPMLRAAFVGGTASLAFIVVVLNAQVDLFVVGAFVGCYALLRRERPFSAGSLLAIALLKPHLIAAVLLLLLIKRQWRALAGFASASAPLLIVPALLSSPRLLVDQARLMLSYTQSADEYRVRAETMINIRGPVTALTGSSNVWLWLPVLVVIAGLAMYVALRVWRERPALHPQSWALAFALPLLYSPHMHFQSIVLLFAAAGLYLVADQSSDSPRIDVQWVLAGFLAVNTLWLLTIAGVPLMAFVVMGAYSLFAIRWPAAAAEPERRTAAEPALAA